MPMLRCIIILLLLTIISADALAGSDKLKIIAVGDSLIAGYGLKSEDSFTSKIEEALLGSGLNANVINAGISGDTTAGGYGRIDGVIAQKPDVVIFCLGANDALRGLDVKLAEANIEKTISKLIEAKIAVLFVGMKAPLNYGAEYSSEFNAIYPKLAKKYKLTFYPFLLDGVAMRPELNQPDGLHPNPEGIKIIVGSILPYLKKMI